MGGELFTYLQVPTTRSSAIVGRSGMGDLRARFEYKETTF